MSAARAVGLEVRPATETDWPAVAALRGLAFRYQGTREGLLPGMWLVAEREAVIACARLQIEAQWFGGRTLPTGLVSSVAVAPEARGRGVAGILLRALLEEARANGCVGVSLYPSALRPYRRAGFAVAGSHVTARLELGTIQVDAPAIVERLDGDLTGLMAHYSRWAATTNGAIARSASWWLDRVLSSDPPTPHGDADTPYAYIVRDGASVVGHAVYTQRRSGDDAYLAEATCRSLAWESPEAGLTLLRLFSTGWPLTTAVTWPASVVDPLGAFLDAQPAILSTLPWMHRLVDAAGAIRARAYPPTNRAAVTLRVEDTFIPEWTVTLAVSVEDGAAHVEEADPAGATSVRSEALAAILAGGLDPRDAVRLGWIRAEQAIVDGLSALVPVGRGWIGDAF